MRNKVIILLLEGKTLIENNYELVFSFAPSLC